MKNESELSAFLVIEYDYDTCDAIIVVVAKDVIENLIEWYLEFTIFIILRII